MVFFLVCFFSSTEMNPLATTKEKIEKNRISILLLALDRGHVRAPLPTLSSHASRYARHRRRFSSRGPLDGRVDERGSSSAAVVAAVVDAASSPSVPPHPPRLCLSPDLHAGALFRPLRGGHRGALEDPEDAGQVSI